ncbi:hypothetical protein KM043_002917 [Ampulex compressa]|nr:hypothetical protein KM043_002917 [Ampulex compressa]
MRTLTKHGAHRYLDVSRKHVPSLSFSLPAFLGVANFEMEESSPLASRAEKIRKAAEMAKAYEAEREDTRFCLGPAFGFSKSKPGTRGDPPAQGASFEVRRL